MVKNLAFNFLVLLLNKIQTNNFFSFLSSSRTPFTSCSQTKTRTVTRRHCYSISSLVCLLSYIIPSSKKPASPNNTEALLKPVDLQKKDPLHTNCKTRCLGTKEPWRVSREGARRRGAKGLGGHHSTFLNVIILIPLGKSELQLPKHCRFSGTFTFWQWRYKTHLPEPSVLFHSMSPC